MGFFYFAYTIKKTPLKICISLQFGAFVDVYATSVTKLVWSNTGQGADPPRFG